MREPAVVVWMTVFLDLPAASYDAGVGFWTAVTGTEPSAPRGERGEFATLLPASGDAHVRVQRVGSGPPRLHLDLHASDHEALAARLVGLGATEVGRLDDVVVLRTPGGLPVCAVPGETGTPSPPLDWPSRSGAHASRLDQVCVDIPSRVVERERQFLADALGTGLTPPGERPEFRDARRPEHLPLRLLLQEVGDEGQPTSAHLDLASTDRPAEVERLVALGAEVEGPGDGWTVLRDPQGMRFCVTDRWPLGLPRP